MDSSSDQLNAVSVGCEDNDSLCNHLMYADDIIFFYIVLIILPRTISKPTWEFFLKVGLYKLKV